MINLLPESGINNLNLVPSSLDSLIKLQNIDNKNFNIIDLPSKGLDITIDGADRVNPEKQCVKGGGGALTREKILREASAEFILVVSAEKVIPQLPMFPIAVEILPFGWKHTIKRLESFGKVSLRLAKSKLGPIISDNHNYIVDIDLGNHCLTPDEVQSLEKQLNMFPGVIENGLFSRTADKVIVGHDSGRITKF